MSHTVNQDGAASDVPVEVWESWTQQCNCAPCCNDCPCGGVMQGGLCDDFTCRCGADLNSGDLFDSYDDNEPEAE